VIFKKERVGHAVIPRSRTVDTGIIAVLTIRTAWPWIWCWRRVDEQQCTSVLLVWLSCRRLAAIQHDTSSWGRSTSSDYSCCPIHSYLMLLALQLFC